MLFLISSKHIILKFIFPYQIWTVGFYRYACFKMPWTRFENFRKMSVLVRWIFYGRYNRCKELHEVLYLIIKFWRKMVSINFWWKSFIRLYCCLFPEILWYSNHSFCWMETRTFFTRDIYFKNNIDSFFMYIIYYWELLHI